MGEADIKGNMMVIRSVLENPKARKEEDLTVMTLAALTLLECFLTDVNRIAEAETFIALETQRANSK